MQASHHQVSASATPSHQRSRRLWVLGAVATLAAASCSSSTTSSPTTAAPPTTASASPTTAGSTDTTVAATVPSSPSSAFPDLKPPTGDQMVIGLVNSEGGVAGLDFPDIRIAVEASVDYLNQHGGMGGRPIKLESCAAKGSPETSQACAQELIGKKVDLVLLGLDLFPDYAAYSAAKIPVIGVLPILPGDYTAKALFLTGGNATTFGAAAAAAKDHFKSKLVGIVSADNVGANASEATLSAALDLAGIAHKTVKGGDNMTDAEYQGLVRQIDTFHPDLIMSLYADAGCIGMMRGRASLGITTPVLTTSICSGKTVLDAAGETALGWTFIGAATQENTPELLIVQAVMAKALKLAPEKVDPTALGLGGLGMIETLSLAEYADIMQAAGTAVTGASLYSFLASAKDLSIWPNGAKIECGASPKYPSICSYTFPFAEYTAGGKVVTVKGLEAVSAKDFLP